MTQPAAGELALVLHTHLPWLKGHGVWPVGEEWLFQAWATSWLPVTDILCRLADEGHRDVLTLGVTPLVASQVADPRLRNDVGTWIADGMWRAEEQRWVRHMGAAVTELATHHWRHHRRLLDLWEGVEQAGGLLAVWADLQDRGVIELLGGPATHPYLPLADDLDFINTQLAIGLDHHASWAGSRPTGIWAPECGYRPRSQVADPSVEPHDVDGHGTPTLVRSGPVLPGLEELYAHHGIRHVVVDAATVVRAAGGEERDWTRRPEVSDPSAQDPYEVVHDGVLIGESDVVAFARDLSVAYHVWSPTEGYPGNQWYRDFFAHGTWKTHPSWRVTDHQRPPDQKDVYEPDRAAAQVQLHADHFIEVLGEVTAPRPGALVLAAYDTELFGHWWYEGPAWLEAVLRGVHAAPDLRTTTLQSRRDRRRATQRLALPESSWGFAKGHATWATEELRPMWRDLRDAQARGRAALEAGGGDAENRRQLLREILLLQCSDWPFLITRGNSPDYAWERFGRHLDAVNTLVRVIDGSADTSEVASAIRLQTLDEAPPNAPSNVVLWPGVRDLEGASASSVAPLGDGIHDDNLEVDPLAGSTWPSAEADQVASAPPDRVESGPHRDGRPDGDDDPGPPQHA